MTQAEGKAFYGRIKAIDAVIEAKAMAANALRLSLLPSGLRYDSDKVQTSPSDQLLSGYVRISDKLERLEAEMRQLMIERADAVAAIDAALERLEDKRESLAIMAYYVKREKVKDIARRMSYSEDMIYLLIRRGIENTQL